MKHINTQIATFNPDIVPFDYRDESKGYVACMFQDLDGIWVAHCDHLIIVENLQKRITYLENCCDEFHDQLCR